MVNWISRLLKSFKIRRAKDISATERDTCERYGEHVIGTMLAGGFSPKPADLLGLYHTEETRQHARDWLTERADYRERRDRWISGRDFVLEIVIIVLIGWEIHEGRQQAKVLEHMDRSTGDTASAMQAARDSLKSLADSQNASLKILQEEQAERAKKPRFGLYLGNVPIDKGPLYLPDVASGEARSTANFNLGLKNEGGVPASPSEIHILVPADIFFTLTLPPLQELEPSKPATRALTYVVPLLPAGKTLQISGSVGVPMSHAPFKATFTITTPQLQSVTPLGSLTVLPAKTLKKHS